MSAAVREIFAAIDRECQESGDATDRQNEIRRLARVSGLPDEFAKDHIARGSSLVAVYDEIKQRDHAASGGTSERSSPPASAKRCAGGDRAAVSASWDKALARVGAPL